MKLNELKVHFDAGALKEAYVTQCPMQVGKWILMFVRRHEKDGDVLINKRNEVRIFSSIDACASVVTDVGFSKFEVRL